MLILVNSCQLMNLVNAIIGYHPLSQRQVAPQALNCSTESRLWENPKIILSHYVRIIKTKAAAAAATTAMTC